MVEKFKTPQEEFWAGEFGTDYIGRNNSAQLLASNPNFFSKALKQAGTGQRSPSDPGKRLPYRRRRDRLGKGSSPPDQRATAQP